MQSLNGSICRSEYNYIRQRLGEVCDAKLQPIEGRTLRAIHQRTRCSQDSLCGELEVDKGRIAKVMAHLEELGLIRRTVNALDKREKVVKLTDEGRDVLEAINRIFEEWSRICYSGFTEEERAQYTAYLERIANNAADYLRREKQLG